MPHRKTDQARSFEFRCKALARVKRRQAARLPPGTDRDCLYQLVHQLETATEIYDFLFDVQKLTNVADQHQAA